MEGEARFVGIDVSKAQLYAAVRPLETGAFSSCCSSVVSSIRYFLAGTTPLLGYYSPMPTEYTSCTSIQ